MYDKFILSFYSLSYSCRYPYDEAATIAISTVKEFRADFKEVLNVYFLPHVSNFFTLLCGKSLLLLINM
jgi:hypothetical protein